MKLIRTLSAGQRRHVTPLTLDSMLTCKRAFSTRNVPLEDMQTLISGDVVPRSGDLVLARVDRLRQQLRLELTDGRRARMFPGDHILVCYGNRYAADQYESQLPENLDPCDLVAAGGIASLMRHRHPGIKHPTQITPLGLVGNSAGSVLNISNCKVRYGNLNRSGIPLFLVVGSSMNAGKTTTAARLVRGMVADGFKVGAMKVTGTGSGGDLWHFLDAGAACALDFTDAGHATTYGLGQNSVLEIVDLLGNNIRNQQVDAIVVEVADGLLQAETHALLHDPLFRDQVNGVFHAAVDAHSAIYGAEFLQGLGYNLIAVSGVVSSSPLARREFSGACEVPIFTKNELCAPGFGLELMEGIANQTRGQLANA